MTRDSMPAFLAASFLIDVVEVLRVEDDTVERLGHGRGCERRRGVMADARQLGLHEAARVC